MGVSSYVCGDQKLELSLFLNHFTYLLRYDLSFKPRDHQFGQSSYPAYFWDLLALTSEYGDYCQTTAMVVTAGYPTTGSLTCIRGALIFDSPQGF